MKFFRHCTAPALLALLAAGVAAAQPAQTPAAGTAQAPASPAPGEAQFSIFLRGTEVGREQVNLARSGANWVITSSGRFGDLAIGRFELRYDADWQPLELTFEATRGQQSIALGTSFGLTMAINEITQNGVTTSKTDQTSARTIVLPNNLFAPYEALAARLSTTQPGAELPVYVAPQAEVKLSVKGISEEAFDTGAGTVNTRKYAVTFHNVGGTVDATITVDSRSRFARLDMPAAGLAVVRNDLAGVGVRPHGTRNPTDTDVMIPANGFSIAATLTTPSKPAGAGRLRSPAVVLVTGSGPLDRDETVAGIPLFAQLAGDLASRGFVVVRYDKRGVGRSGGRTETATLRDYADDLVAVVKWLEKRDDVDKNRLAVAGHSEGGVVAMIAAGREKKIKSLVLMGVPGTTGAELILEQQRQQLDKMELSAEERQAKIDLQKQIQAAVVDGGEEAWKGVPDELRRQADTPWFRSLLQFDPAEAMKRTEQSILIVQAELDTQVPPHHGARLAELARARDDDEATVELVQLSGLNHLYVPAKSGEVSEYASLPEKRISPRLADTIAEWVKGQPQS